MIWLFFLFFPNQMCARFQLVLYWFWSNSTQSTYLKALSIEMDLAESGFVWKIFIKGRSAENFSELRHLVKWLVIRNLIANGEPISSFCFCFSSYKDWHKRTMKKFGIYCNPNGAVNFSLSSSFCYQWMLPALGACTTNISPVWEFYFRRWQLFS